MANLKLRSTPYPSAVSVHLPPASGVMSGRRASVAAFLSVPAEKDGGMGMVEKLPTAPKKGDALATSERMAAAAVAGLVAVVVVRAVAAVRAVLSMRWLRAAVRSITEREALPFNVYCERELCTYAPSLEFLASESE